MDPIETTPDILRHCVDSFGDRVALCGHGEGAERYSYSRLGRDAAALARRLAEMGVEKGSSVVLLSENRPEWALAYFAIHLAGGICVPVDSKLTAAEIGNIVAVSRTRLVIVSRQFHDVVAQARRGRSDIAAATLEDLLAELPTGGSAEPIRCPVGPDCPAVISFTSGTTGASKGIVLTHRNIAANALAATRKLDISGDDRLLSILPLHHLFEQTGGMLVPMLSGASVTYAESLNPRNIAEVMRRSGTTIALVVPALARLFHKRIDSELRCRPRWQRAMFRAGRVLARGGRALRIPAARLLFRDIHRAFGGKLRFFMCGGAPLDAGLARFFRDIGIPMLQGYGLSEASPIVASSTLREDVIGSVGRPLPGVEVKIRPLTAAGQADDEAVGEILVRGPNVMAGYFEDGDATGEVVRDGWLHTGDLGTINSDGFLFVVGRLKDVIIAESGKNVYPEEVEAELVRCACVRDACVIGIPAGQGAARTEEVVALIVPDAEAMGPSPADPAAQIRRQLQEASARLARYKRPRRFAIWPGEFPRTTTMKLKKFAIRRQIGELDLQPL